MSLNYKLKQIGINISFTESSLISDDLKFIDIEKTIVESIIEAPNDPRLISLLLSWIEVHGKYVIVEKLSKLIEQTLINNNDFKKNRWIYVLAAYAFSRKYHKWKKLCCNGSKKIYVYPKELTLSAIKIKGAIPWAKKFNILIPKNSLRVRTNDILSPQDLLKKNLQYKNRYIYGVCWRADIVSAVQLGIKKPTAICQILGCSYEPAHRISKEYQMAMEC
jgi:hypothetical protein